MMANIKPFKDQNYEELKSMHDEENLFEDPYFPADDSSLFRNSPVPKGICWMRPNIAQPNPQFVVNGFGRCDMDQGYLGNCWFIAACVAIVQNKKLFAKIVPDDQSFSENYAGIFHFRFWQYGEWVDVVVDDRLPHWPDKRLVFCSNREEKNEYWGALLEKAYAKLNGSYENLESGQTFDALVDLSGGVQESFEIKKLARDQRNNFWNTLNQSFLKETLMSCSINADKNVREARLSNGLVKGHAFTITNLATVQIRHNSIKIIRIKNPWGNNVEWKGAWSDYSREWDMVSEDQKRELNVTRESDGEFWMSYEDFMYYFDVVQMCHLTIDSFSTELLETDDDSDLTWKCITYHSAWETGKTAGGSGQYNQAKYWTNPQFMVKLVDVDENDNEDKATVIVALMQKNSRLKRARNDDGTEEYIQFRLYKIKDNVSIDETITTGLRLYANDLIRMGSSGPYINNREVTQRFRVEPGYYLIIPSTYDEDVAHEFMLRIFTEQLIQLNNLKDYKADLDEENISFEVVESEMNDSYYNHADDKKDRINDKKECSLM